MFSRYKRSKEGRKSHFLGFTVHHQKDDEAEVLRQATNRQEQKFGKDHKDTLDSKHRLGQTLYYQGKYNEAENIFREAVHGQEQKLGKDHEDTLDSKSWLGYTLYYQKKYGEAEEVF
jgi:tetratricopeptide (TPR) repeat protein